METTLDSGLVDSKNDQNDKIEYGGFWPRLGALFIDGLVLAPVTIGLSYFNVVEWKSAALLIVITIAGLVYKPYCEFKFGATLGKMALKLKVVNQEFAKPSLQEILFRNIFQIVPPLISLIFSIMIFNSPEFQDITGFMDYSTKLNANRLAMSVNWIIYILFIIDFICLVSDKQKKSLHDRIGNTYVIQQS